MKLNPVGSNMTEIELGDVTVFFSYKTPVACHIAGKGYYKTDKYYSKTTSGHITKWLKLNGASMDKVTVLGSFDDMIQGLLAGINPQVVIN